MVLGIASVGRVDQLTRTVQQVLRQRSPAERLVIAVPSPEDVDERSVRELHPHTEIVFTRRGLTLQRNAIIDRALCADLIAFIDDDFYPSPDYFAHARAIFEQYQDVAAVTGHPRLDGAHGAAVDHRLAVSESEREISPVAEQYQLYDTYGTYGCNMVFRASVLREHNLRFDENLPLYGWLEDLELSRRLVPYGRIVGSRSLKGVHLGTRAGRQPGTRLGYSQVMNPVYMACKGSMDAKTAWRFIRRNVAKNVLKAPRPEPWVDRRGRLAGNVLAVCHALQGYVKPSYVLELDPNTPTLTQMVRAARRPSA